MKKSMKKLSINKVTISNLSTTAMSQIAGGSGQVCINQSYVRCTTSSKK